MDTSSLRRNDSGNAKGFLVFTSPDEIRKLSEPVKSITDSSKLPNNSNFSPFLFARKLALDKKDIPAICEAATLANRHGLRDALDQAMRPQATHELHPRDLRTSRVEALCITRQALLQRMGMMDDSVAELLKSVKTRFRHQSVLSCRPSPDHGNASDPSSLLSPSGPWDRKIKTRRRTAHTVGSPQIDRTTSHEELVNNLPAYLVDVQDYIRSELRLNTLPLSNTEQAFIIIIFITSQQIPASVRKKGKFSSTKNSSSSFKNSSLGWSVEGRFFTAEGRSSNVHIVLSLMEMLREPQSSAHDLFADAPRHASFRQLHSDYDAVIAANKTFVVPMMRSPDNSGRAQSASIEGFFHVSNMDMIEQQISVLHRPLLAKEAFPDLCDRFIHGVESAKTSMRKHLGYYMGNGVSRFAGVFARRGGKFLVSACVPRGLTGVPTRIACGMDHLAVLTTTGVFTLGASARGQLGRLVDGANVAPISQFPANARPYSVACGANHTGVIMKDGSVYLWGSNEWFQLGNAAVSPILTKPVRLQFPIPVAQLVCGAAHTMLRTETRKVFAFGCNALGQCGIGQFSMTEKIPREVIVDVDGQVVDIACGPFSSAAVTHQGLVYVWGFFMGADFTTHASSPRLLASYCAKHHFARKIVLGATHLSILGDDKAGDALKQLILCNSHCRPSLANLRYRLYKVVNPEDVLKPLQDRTMRWLNDRVSPQPMFTVNQACFILKNTPGTRAFDRTITFHNLDKGKVIDLVLIPEQTGSVKVELSSSSVVLAKKPVKVNVFVHVKEKIETNPNLLIQVRGRTRGTTQERPSLYQILLKFESMAKLTRQDKTCFTQHSLLHEVVQTVKTLATYTPRLLIKLLTDLQGPLIRPFSSSFEGAILFVDITGFTSFSEMLSRFGPTGPEQVTLHVNKYFSSLIKLISMHHGDVTAFAGDAMICLFGGLDSADSLQTSTLRAVQCGLHIQRKFSEYIGPNGVTLKLHIGVGAGELLFMAIGGLNSHWDSLLSGEPLKQLSKTMENSTPGAVVVSQEAWQAVSEHCSGVRSDNSEDWIAEEVKEPVPPEVLDRPQIPLKIESKIRCFVPLLVQQRVDSRQSAWIDELRKCSVIFIKLGVESFDMLNTEEYARQLNSIYCCIQRLLDQMGGCVNGLLNDDKGTLVIATFGVPPYAHKDDQARAVSVSQQIHCRLRELGIKSNIGIATGVVFCGCLGSTERHHYTVIGDDVNLAARLMMCAYSMNIGVVCDARTARAASNIAFDEVGRVKVKGKAKKVLVFRPFLEYNRTRLRLASKSISSDNLPSELHLPFVGREKERAEIQKCLDDLMYEMPPFSLIYLIQGESGMGRSKLAHFFMMMCHARPVDCIIGAPLLGDEERHRFHEFRGIVRAIFELPCDFAGLGPSSDIATKALVSEKVAHCLTRFSIEEGSWEYSSLAVLNDIIDIGIEEGIDTKFLDETARINVTHRIIISLVRKLVMERTENNRRIAFIFEELLQMSIESQHLVACIVEEITPIMVLMTSDLIDEFIARKEVLRILTHPRTCETRLYPLSHQHICELAGHVLSVNDVSSELSLLLRKAHGSPMACLELLTQLKRDDAITFSPNNTTAFVRPTTSLTDPSLDSGRSSRKKSASNNDAFANNLLDSLPVAMQMVLKCASAVGFKFSLPLLISIYPIATERPLLNQQLRRLELKGLLSSFDGRNKVVSYKFSDINTYQAAYARLLYSQRLQLHRSIISALTDDLSMTHITSTRRDLSRQLAFQYCQIVEHSLNVKESLLMAAVSSIIAIARLDPVNGLLWARKGMLLVKQARCTLTPRGKHQLQLRLNGVTSQDLLRDGSISNVNWSMLLYQSPASTSSLTRAFSTATDSYTDSDDETEDEDYSSDSSLTTSTTHLSVVNTTRSEADNSTLADFASLSFGDSSGGETFSIAERLRSGGFSGSTRKRYALDEEDELSSPQHDESRSSGVDDDEEIGHVCRQESAP